MFRRPLSSVRAWTAAGLVAVAALSGRAALADDATPVPDAGAETVDILKAEQTGAIRLSVRGNGQQKVHFTIKNTSSKRLNVVIPPGLVASAGAAQGGGFQSMGLGTPTDHAGAFGAFSSNAGGNGFRSVAVSKAAEGIAVAPGAIVDLNVPAACLNFGIPTPTPKDAFRLVSVDEYTPDVRARRALRTLATLGTSQGVAQAALWQVFNGMSPDQEIAQCAQYLNLHEIAVATRFVQTLETGSGGDVIEPQYFNQGRVLVRLRGEGASGKDAQRLAGELDGKYLMGLPCRVVTDVPDAAGYRAALLLDVVLDAGNGRLGRLSVRHSSLAGGWVVLGNGTIKGDDAAGNLKADDLARALDRSVAAVCVNVKAVRKSTTGGTFRIENRLPFTVANVVLRTGKGADAASVPIEHIGIGPRRTAFATLPAAVGTIERVELNGL